MSSKGDKLREERHKKLEDEVLEAMTDRPDLCGDDTHALACEMIQHKYGIHIDTDMVKYISSVGRARRKILQRFPLMDQRTKHKDLEQQDREYHRDN